MAVESSRQPVVKQATVLSGAFATLTFSTWMGAVYIKNNGLNTVFLKFDGAPGVVAADGQFTLKTGEIFNLDDCIFKTIGIFCTAVGGGADAQVEAVALVRSGVGPP